MRDFYRLLLSLNGLFCVLFLSVVIMEPNLDDPGFVSPLDPDPSPRAPVPLSGSSSSSEGAVDVRRKCLHCHRRMSRNSFDSHTFCSVCRGFDCDLDNRCEECTDWPESDIVAYVKHRKMLKSKQSKPTGSDVPLSPSQPSVRSSQPVPDFDIEARIASLSAELSASLALQVEGLGSSLQQSFLALSSDLSTQLAARIFALSSTSCTLTPSVSAPVRLGQALSPHPPVSTAGLL